LSCGIDHGCRCPYRHEISPEQFEIAHETLIPEGDQQSILIHDAVFFTRHDDDATYQYGQKCFEIFCHGFQLLILEK
jgi:hypothetical protein